MLTAILWITLAASIILLIAVASPIRVSCNAIYKEENRDTDLRAAAYYLHPLILRIEYSSTEERFKLFILGFEKRRRVDEDINAEDTDADGDDIFTDSIDTDDIGTDVFDTDDISIDDIGTDSICTDGINTGSINNEENINTTVNSESDTDTKEKKKPFSLSKIKSMINDVKDNRIYKILGDKPLRKKLLRWLKRSLARAIRAVSFEKLKIHVRIGMADPAALGKIYGYFSATKSALTQQYYHIDLSMEPVFMEKRLDIDSELKIKTTLSTIMWQLTVIAATFPYFKVWRIIRK